LETGKDKTGEGVRYKPVEKDVKDALIHLLSQFLKGDWDIFFKGIF
jgi:hypothetical protein